MSNITAWAVFYLGVAHIVFGVVRFRVPLAAAVMAGFAGQFMRPEARRTAFWFLMCGALFMLAGHVAVHAVAVGDLKLLKVIGIYLFISSLIGVVAFPISPLWGPLLLSLLLMASGYGLMA